MKRTLLALAMFALSGCGASGGNPIAPSSPANLATNVLQMAAGTANLYGTATALNLVATYRQPKGGFKPGDSGALLDSPALTLPAALTAASGTGASYDASSTILTGPAPGELGTMQMAFTTQNPGASGTTTFGQSALLSGLGIEPFNQIGSADVTPPSSPSLLGTPFQVAPYPVPLYDSLDVPSGNTDPNLLVPWGGPPAFVLPNSNGDSVVGSPNEPAGTAGISEGLDVFAGIAPVAGGAYTLSVSVPANTGTVTQHTTFTLPALLHVLGTASAPAFAPNGSGGGTFAVTMPSGATEAYLEIVNYGPTSGTSCDGFAGSSSPVYFTLETTSSQTLTLPNRIGPAGTPSVCTAAQNTAANGGTATSDDQIAIQLLGFDYPAYEMSYPASLGNPAPVVLGSSGEDDLTISAAACQVGMASCTGSLPLRRSLSTKPARVPAPQPH